MNIKKKDSLTYIGVCVCYCSSVPVMALVGVTNIKREVEDDEYGGEVIHVQFDDGQTEVREGDVEMLTLQLKEEHDEEDEEEYLQVQQQRHSTTRGSRPAAGVPAEESDSSMRSRLVESLCMSFPGSALSRALHMMEADEEEEAAENGTLSQSCFAQLRLDQASVAMVPENNVSEDDDDELTSLAWLQDRDLLRNINPADRSLCTSPNSDDGSQKENDFDGMQDVTGSGSYYGQPHPPNVPYNPQKHVNSKPPYSFSCLIFMAIEDSPTKRLPVKEIYNWIVTNYPYFQNAPTGWKNSVRHNLSLNKCFRKVDKERGSVSRGYFF